MAKVCAQCENFLGGGDWGLSCSKKYGLTCEDTDATNCENFTQETACKNNSSVVGGFRCSICGAFKSFVKVDGQVSIEEYVRLSRKAESLVKGFTECPMCGEKLGDADD